ncbi:MAG: preprotein translocase [Bacteroidetes bacterium]|nr:preprotein translocase [Bacteroidota bacterium]
MSATKAFFLVIFFCSFSLFLRSQTAVADTGKIELVQDYKIKDLVAKHVELNAKSNLKGYRLKIHFGSDKTKAREIKAKFIAKFPNVPAYEKYDQPNFNIRVGDFRTKLEAYRFLKEVQPEFPSAFIVLDEIELPEIR